MNKTKQFLGEEKPRSLYVCTRSGGSDRLETYAHSVRRAFEQAGFQQHSIVEETATLIRSESGGQTFETKLA